MKNKITLMMGDTVFVDATVPFQFALPAPEPGLYQLEIKVLDSLYGFNTRNITFSVLTPDQQNGLHGCNFRRKPA